ncbi:MAG: hypothetical protein ACP6IY_02210 [Promethearchaeia archaeon]
MSDYIYFIGVFSAIIAGVIFNIGIVMQKIVINKLPKDIRLMKTLIKEPLWISGLLLQYILGSIFLLIAQVFIGPVLIPGLLSIGLIVLAIGSIKIIGEKLNYSEYLGIGLMITAIFMLSFSGLAIELINENYLELGFLTRAYLFSAIYFILTIILGFLQKKFRRFRGILLALISGILFSIENLWLGIALISFGKFVVGNIEILEIIVLLIAIIFIVIINIYGVIALQKAFQYGQASNLTPIQNVPTQLSPIFLYFIVFLLIPSSFLSILLLIFGIILILISTYLLGKRQAVLEEII